MRVKSVVAVGLVLALGVGQVLGVELTRDDATGAKFGTPGPRLCSTHNDPENGPLTAEAARAYVICGYEMEFQGGSDLLYLLGNVQITSIVGRAAGDDRYDDIDVDKPVYDIAGTSVVYVCDLLGGTLGPDQQCTQTPNPNDYGFCYQTLGAEWRCNWTDDSVDISNNTNLRVAAPTLAEAE